MAPKTYCSEVWGIYDKSDYNRWDKDSIEKTHIHFCKMCLGLNKRSPNVASRNELGRLSLNLQITMNILKFWIHLENQPPDSIPKLCLNISRDQKVLFCQEPKINKLRHKSILKGISWYLCFKIFVRLIVSLQKTVKERNRQTQTKIETNVTPQSGLQQN